VVKKKRNMYIDRKCTIWVREYLDDSLTQEEVIEMIESGDDLEVDPIEYLYETVEEMTSEENDFNAIVELYDNEELIYKK